MGFAKRQYYFWLLVLMCVPIVNASHGWGYQRQNNWPGYCTQGKLQSPINIEVSQTVYDRSHLRGKLQFSGYENVDMDVVNNGHTVQWTVKSSPPELSGGPLHEAYYLHNVHLHWTSEHKINGAEYGMEIHLVHVKQGYTLANAIGLSDGLSVIAVLCQVDDRIADQSALMQLMPIMNSVMSKTSQPIPAGIINVRKFMGNLPEYYYTYQGSLTTPDCNEAVIWIVMDQPIFITQAQYNHMIQPDVGGRFNFRFTQPVHRVVYRSYSNQRDINLESKAEINLVSNVLFNASVCISLCVYYLKIMRELNNILSLE